MNNWPLFIAGITDSYNPCSIGVLLISLTILVGMGQRKLVTIFGLSYLTMIFVVYFLVGLGILRAFHMFGIHGFFGYAAGGTLIIVGIAHLMPNFLKTLPGVSWLNRCYTPSVQKHLDKGVFISGLILGFLIGLCTIPCAGGIYIGAIALLAAKVTYWQGVWSIFIFNLGFILPLLTIFFLASRPLVLNKLKEINHRLSSYSTVLLSAIMIVMGIVLLWIS